MTDIQKTMVTDYTDMPVCPHCGWKKRHLTNIILSLLDDNEDAVNFQCEACGKPYKATQHIKKTYSTRAVRCMSELWKRW